MFNEFFGGGGFRQPKKGKNLLYRLNLTFKEAVSGVTKNLKIDDQDVEVKIPAGVNTGTELRVSGKGAQADDTKLPRGDLFLEMVVDEPKDLQREGSSLVGQLEITISQAVLGDSVMVNVVDIASVNGLKEIKVKIPSGTQTGTNLKLKGRGIKKLRGYGNGDVYYQINIKIPSNLDRKSKKLFKELKELGH